MQLILIMPICCRLLNKYTQNTHTGIARFICLAKTRIPNENVLVKHSHIQNQIYWYESESLFHEYTRFFHKFLQNIFPRNQKNDEQIFPRGKLLCISIVG